MFISKKKYEEMIAATNLLLESLEEMKKKSFLIGIEREGRENIFTFVRGDKVHQVRTMGLLSDDLPQWKKDLLR